MMNTKTPDTQVPAISGIKYIDLKLDYSFKRVFGTQGNEDLLLLLVNCILPDKQITSVTLGPQEQQGDYEDSRDCIFDVYCTTNNGSRLVIEIQLNDKKDFAKRMVYYSGFPIRNQVGLGMRSYDYNDVYVIGILDFELPGNATLPNEFINTFTYRNDKDGAVILTSCSTLVTVELPKFKKHLPELETVGDKLIYCLKHQGEFKEIPKELQCPELEKMFGISNFATLTENEQNMYMREFKEMLDRESELSTAESKGVDRGFAQGHTEGRAEGFAEGRAENNLQIAKQMKADGLSIEMIMHYTHLTPEQIAQL